EDALKALLDAVLDLQQADELGDLEQLDIIELYEHRAIAAMQALAKLHKQPRYEGHLDIKLELKQGEGAIRKIVLEQPTDWARRIQVQEMDVAGGRYRGLQYAVLTGSARIEDTAVPDTLKLADAFIKAAIEQTQFDGRSSPGRTLFELLLPRRLKLASDEDRDLVLMLDRFAAGYPWELMEDPAGDDDEPPAIRAGLIRQLHDERFRPDVQITSQRTALVIGDPKPTRPDPRFPALNGAVEEAQTVSRLISRAGYAVTEEIRTLPTSAIATFMNEPYRIMHLAGHGVFEQVPDEKAPESEGKDEPCKNCPKTGMVFGDGLFLTPSAVKQLTNVPELVFLNCCYLGRVDASAEQRTKTLFHELAANLATQFIQIGAKAVIAAGWAVDDAAALTFATTFYQAMLDDGETFINAVKKARVRAYTTHPYTNSWGAYQAYGDPAFTLNGKKPTAGDGDTKWYHPYEAKLAFEELTQKAQTTVRADLADLRQRFASHWKSTDAKWQKRSDLLAAKAQAAGELGLFSEAIKTHEQAITAEKSEATIRAVEQCANLRARYAVHLAKGKAEPEKVPGPEPLDMIIESWRELERLDDRQTDTNDRQPNIERLNLFGSAAKRASQLYVSSEKTAVDLLRESKSTADQKTFAERYLKQRLDRKGFPDEQIEWLKRSAAFYKKAHDADPDRAYALTNWLSICALIHLRDGTIDTPKLVEQERRLKVAAGAEEAADLEKPGFWEFAAKGDHSLAKLLIHAADKLQKAKDKNSDAYMESFKKLVDERKGCIAEHYLDAWKRGGSILKMNSGLEQLDFFIDALAIGESRTKFERNQVTAAISYIKSKIDHEMNVKD
ncbi:MAG: CHAT domain-containing protein, partial [Geminicoccaceae bacterium]